MRTLLPVFLCWLPFASAMSVRDAGLFVFGHDSASRHDLDDRLNVGDVQKFIDSRLRDRSTELGQVDEKIVQELDHINGGHSRVLGAAETETADHLLVVWEGVSFDESISDSPSFSAYFNIPNGASQLNRQYFDKLFSHDDNLRSTCDYRFQASGGYEVRLKVNSQNKNCLSGSQIITRGSSLSLDALLRLLIRHVSLRSQRAVINIGQQDNGLQPDEETVDAVFAALRDSVTSSNQQILLLSSLSALLDGSSSKKQRRRFEPAEQRLSDIVSSSNDGAPVSALPKGSQKQDIKVPSTIMPSCYASNATCNEHTHSCSGHGYCYQKSSSKNSVASKECFACKCVATVVSRHPDGRPKKTIQWGGPACQKKDVSTPFFIFATLTVLIALAVIGSIRLLFNMGQEELPSVLSAGVAAKVQK